MPRIIERYCVINAVKTGTLRRESEQKAIFKKIVMRNA